MMKVLLKEFSNLVSAYEFLDEATQKGHLPLELSPIEGGCRLLLRMQGSDIEGSIELSETILQAYLGLNSGKTEAFVAIEEVQTLLEGFEKAKFYESMGLLIHEIRVFKKRAGPHYLISSHQSRAMLESSIKGPQKTILSHQNSALMEFLGFSNIAVNRQL